MPEVTFYKPAGIPLEMLKEVKISVEEMETIRLKDLEGLEQEAAAQRMNISRATFQRILYAARHKIAWSLTHGQAIRIEGGVFNLSSNRLECKGGHHWDAPAHPGGEELPKCPKCGRPGIIVDV
jgi:predicted DNA-binding protein (UPF0251 family)